MTHWKKIIGLVLFVGMTAVVDRFPERTAAERGSGLTHPGQINKAVQTLEPSAMENRVKLSSYSKIFAAPPRLEKAKSTSNEDRPSVETERDHDSVSHDLLLVGQKIGLIEDQLAVDPKLLSKAVKFYSNCTTNDELNLSLRSLCYFHLKEHDPQNRILTGSQIPSEVKEAADSLLF